MEENNLEIKNGKVWLGEDGIIRIKIGKNTDLDSLKKLTGEFIDIAKTFKKKSKVLIDINIGTPNFGIIWRKGIIQILLDVYQDPGFEKIAFWGTKKKMIEVLGMFVIGATGFKNIKYFETEEKALKWLEES